MTELGTLLKSGMPARKEEGGIESTHKSVSLVDGSLALTTVISVVKSMKARKDQALDFVLMLVNLNGDGQINWTIFKSNAQSVK